MKILSLFVALLLKIGFMFGQTTYTFTGNGNWTKASNWTNNATPPDTLANGSTIIISPLNSFDSCILDKRQVIYAGGEMRVLNNARLVISAALIIDNFESYFADTSSNKSAGANIPTLAELLPIAYVDELDSAFVNRTTTTPETVSLNVPPPGDQGVNNSCVGWTVGYGMMGYYYSLLKNNFNYTNADNLFSPSFVWNQLNTENGIHINKGIGFPQAFNLVKSLGDCKINYMPANTPYFINPSVGASANAANYKFDAYYRLRLADIQTMKFLLFKKNPLAVIVKIDSGFVNGKFPSTYKLLPDGKLVWKEYDSAKYLGNHAMLICGYDENVKAFKVLNSWGVNWGNKGADKGFFWLDYNLLNTVVVKVQNGSNFEPIIFGAIKKTLLPVDSTVAVDSITSTSAISGGVIIDNGSSPILSAGVCWSTSQNPTIFGNKTSDTLTNNTYRSKLLNLMPGTTYYVRAYATNSTDTAYGNVLSFTTPANLLIGKWKCIKQERAYDGAPTFYNDVYSQFTQGGTVLSSSNGNGWVPFIPDLTYTHVGNIVYFDRPSLWGRQSWTIETLTQTLLVVIISEPFTNPNDGITRYGKAFYQRIN